MSRGSRSIPASIGIVDEFRIYQGTCRLCEWEGEEMGPGFNVSERRRAADELAKHVYANHITELNAARSALAAVTS